MRRRLAPLAVASALTLLGASSRGPHPGPSVGLEFDVSDKAVVCKVLGEQRTLVAWLGAGMVWAEPETPWIAPLAPSEHARLLDAIATLFRERNRIAIEGVNTAPRVTAIEVPPIDSTGYGVPALAFELHWDCASRPRTVDIQWGSWEELTWYDQVRLPLMFRELGDVTIGTVTPLEPTFVWHASLRPPPAYARPDELRIELDGVLVPMVSLGTVLIALGLAPFLRKAPRVAIPLILGAALTAFFARDLAIVRVSSPFGTTRPADDAAASAIVDGLVNNLYAAFDGRREEEIYEALAVSVVPELLAELYGQIYESLILRNQGGAVCRVETIDVVERTVALDAEIEPWDLLAEERADQPRFCATWTWTARGFVSHWGHAHRRENRYQARLWICRDAGAWRIGSFEVLDHQRVDSDG